VDAEAGVFAAIVEPTQPDFMPVASAIARKRFLVPETIQSSLMDCGPAALKSLLGGFNLDASYGFLRKTCETSVDGTSIDVVEEVATQLGLEAEQVVIPPEYVLLQQAHALPAVVVIN